MEKDIGRIPKNPETDIVIRIDDFGGKIGLTIREFANSETYKGFTKSGTRIAAEHFEKFKEMINSIDPKDLKPEEQSQEKLPEESNSPQSNNSEEMDSGVDSEGLM